MVLQSLSTPVPRSVWECSKLEEWYGTSFTEALYNNDAYSPGACEIRETSDKGKLLDECEGIGVMLLWW